jgi:acyl transferase domain-containing protein
VPESVPGLIGVFAGATANSYYLTNLQSRPEVTDKLGLLTTQMANQEHYIATRAAYKLNLRGPALNIQTACSTSLVAVCTAVQSLQSYQCDMALAGGVSVTLPQRRGYLHQEGSILSPDGVCRAFDHRAEGTVFSNGLGVVVLRRLADALHDGDTIYAVIKGAALNNDGHDKLSFTAPSVQGQAEVISLAQAAGGIDPQTITYVEAHGTGTALGDPIEVAALTQAFRAGGDTRRGACALASVKTQIGHLDAAAGVTGLIRAALALHHRTLPGNLHFEAANPKLQLDESPFYVNSAVKPWPQGPGLRRAGVSSFGVGGTNAHVVLEEAPSSAARRVQPSDTAQPQEQLILLSALDEAALRRRVDDLGAHWTRPKGTPADGMEPEVWADTAYTLRVGRRAFPWRQAFVGREPAEVVQQMASPSARPLRARDKLRVAFLFPGQGSQQVNAGRSLYAQETTFREEMDACAAALRAPLGLDIRELMWPSTGRQDWARAQLAQTALAQPALLSLQLALARLWMHWGIQPALVLGHSLGEFAAACLAGTFSRNDVLMLVAERGRLMQDMQDGAMLAVRAAALELTQDRELMVGVDVAAVNGPKATVLSGSLDAIESLASKLEARGVGCKRLPGNRAFHSAMMDPVVEAFDRCVSQVRRNAPTLAWVSSVTGQLITAQDACSVSYWARQLRAPVQFSDALATLVGVCDATLEVGSGDTLTRLVQQQAGARGLSARVASLPADPVADDRERAALLSAAGQLWCAGAQLNEPALQPGPRRRVPLPTYPFARNRHWIDRAPRAASGEPNAVPDTVKLTTDVPSIPLSVPAHRQRRDLLVGQLQALFADLAGAEAHALDPSAQLLEWGLDSLILTQASQNIQNTFGIRVPMRALLEDLSTLDALADHLLPRLPEPAAPPVAAPPPGTSAPVSASNAPQAAQMAGAAPRTALSSASAPATLTRLDGSAPLNGWLGLFAQQLTLMNQQLQMVRDSGHLASVTELAVASAMPAAAAASAASMDQTWAAVPVSDPAPTAQAIGGFGPFRPPQRTTRSSPSAAPDPAIETSLQSFLARYAERTARSKAQAQQNRRHLADPRSVAGYRQALKEIVYPIVTERSQGAYLWDVDGHRYIDITNGFGMILFGHNPPFIRDAVQRQLETGYEIGPQSPLAGEVARELCEMIGMERAAFCATGSEAVMAAMRLARTVTGRDRIVMFSGAYHGIFDEVLMRPARTGSRAATPPHGAADRALPIAPGIPASAAENIVVLDYGTEASLQTLRDMGSSVAAVLVEPVQSRRPDLQPAVFLQALRTLTAESGTALIFDEVVTGFRCHPGGAQAWFGIRADLATYGKVLGGGLPIGVVAGSARFMDALDGGAWQFGDASAPEVGVTFFAGTFVRHPLALAAARAVLKRLREQGPALQVGLNERTARLVRAMQAEIDSLGAPLNVTHFSSWFHFRWTQDVPYASLFFAAMRMRGLHVWEGRPSFLTTAHTDSDLEDIVAAVRESLAELQQLGLIPSRRGTNASMPVTAAPLPVPAPPTDLSAQQAPFDNARRGRDSQGREAWFVPDPERPGKYLQVMQGASHHA